mmetsp:Transcript_5721/g.6785  ORF Transcript_5721/g.6785 Transcript_5721/m.6785 type:complete len:112 (-) Transcript_5721:1992-2327(-)
MQIFEALLSDNRIDPAEEDNAALRVANEANNIEIINKLLNDSRISIPAGILRHSFKDGASLTIVKRLLANERISPPVAEYFLAACDSNSLENVRFLLSLGADPISSGISFK